MINDTIARTSKANHERWLAETWQMIEECAAATKGDRRRTVVSLSPGGCAALVAERDAHETLQGDSFPARHTLDCDMVKHPNCTACNCGSSVDSYTWSTCAQSPQGGVPAKGVPSGPAALGEPASPLACRYCPARFMTAWEHEVHEKEHAQKASEPLSCLDRLVAHNDAAVELAHARGVRIAELESAASTWAKYTTTVGEAGTAYMQSKTLDGRDPTPNSLRWHELWDVMNKAARAPADGEQQ